MSAAFHWLHAKHVHTTGQSELRRLSLGWLLIQSLQAGHTRSLCLRLGQWDWHVAVRIDSHNFFQVGPLSIVHHWASSGGWTLSSESFTDVFLLNSRVVLAHLRNGWCICRFICKLLVRLDRLVVDASFVLCHQNVILSALLVCFYLRVQRVEVVLLYLVFSESPLFFSCLYIRDPLSNLLCIMDIVLSIKHLFSFFLFHLHVEGDWCLILVPYVLVSFFLHILELPGVSLSHLLEHDFLVTLCRIFEVAVRLVIVELIVLDVISLLEALHLFKVLLAVFGILVHLLILLLCKKHVIFPDLYLRFFFDSLLEV